jgi:EAL domain-containing protein (putative c-di-GMP-specific phosphodiesterase class I)
MGLGVKLARSFTGGLPHNLVSSTIVRAIAGLSRNAA